MNKKNERELNRKKRHTRITKKIRGTGNRPRLVVKRSLSNFYAQVVNDEERRTMVSLSTLSEAAREQTKGKSKTEQSKVIGMLLAKKCVEANITAVVFDRGGYKFHGRVKAFAEGAREGGLSF